MNSFLQLNTKTSETLGSISSSQDEVYSLHKSLVLEKMQKGSSAVSHCLSMKEKFQRLYELGHVFPDDLARIQVILSLDISCKEVVDKFKYSNCTFEELCDALQKVDEEIMIKDFANLEMDKPIKIGKGKTKNVYLRATSHSMKRKTPQKFSICFHCNEMGHWKRNCPDYLALVKKEKAGTSTKSGMYVIGLYSCSSDSWVFDTGCGTHICNSAQGLKRRKELKAGDLDLHVGNGEHVQVKAIRSYELLLPSGLILILDNCCYAPGLTRNIISVDRLKQSGFIYGFSNKGITAHKDGLFYFEACPNNGIYEIDLLAPTSNNNSIYTCEKKHKGDFQNHIYGIVGLATLTRSA